MFGRTARSLSIIALHPMEEESSKFGLHISWAKTKVQNLGAGPDAQDLVVKLNHANSSAECVRRIALARCHEWPLRCMETTQSQSTHKVPPLFCLCYDCTVLMAMRHRRSVKACGYCIPYAMSAQNPLNQVERLHPECYSVRHIWLGQYHQHSSCAPIKVIRPLRQIQSWCSSV